MTPTPKYIQFKNSQNPDSGFDIIRLEEIKHRTDLDHSPFHSHIVSFFIIIFIENGKGKHTIDFNDYECKRGTILTIRKDQLHKFFKNQNIKGLAMIFTADFLLSQYEKLESQKSMQLFNELLGLPKIQLSKADLNEITDLINRIKTEYFKRNDSYSLSLIRSELHILITKLYRIKSHQKQVISNRKYLAEFIEFQKLVENKVTQTTRVIDFASMLNISTKTLNNISRSIVHKSAKAFIDEICTKQIKRLLINTELSIKEIAYDTGFEETTNFYKYFKRQTGTTPEQFRITF